MPRTEVDFTVLGHYLIRGVGAGQNKPLEELQEFMAAEKHLSNVPSAEEIREKGLSFD